MCFKSCSEILEYFFGNSNYKIDCKNKSEYIDDTTDDYNSNYINDTTNVNCNIKCKTCNDESNINDLCLSCNTENNYYPIINNNSNSSYIDCYNFTPSRFAFDNDSLSYKPCYSSCKECKALGDNYNHQCSQCIDGYYLNNNTIVIKILIIIILMNGICITVL